MQYAGRSRPDGRGVLYSAEGDGGFWFRAIKPVPYPIPHDGPVGRLLGVLKRHPYRPAHMHFMFQKEGFDRLVTWVLSLSFKSWFVVDGSVGSWLMIHSVL